MSQKVFGCKQHNSGLSMIRGLTILVLLSILQSSRAQLRIEKGMKTEVFLSPKFVMEPGSVSEKFFYGADFPRGHIAIKNFMAEVVDEEGNSVPLHETYLHHWLMVRYYQPKGAKVLKAHGDLESPESDILIVRNSGLCEHGLSQYFGLGSETRRTATNVPDPYGIVVGDPADVPDGYEEHWMLNVHAIDTRGAEDKSGCIECRCDLYNISLDGYTGGLRCCHDQARCRVKDGFQGVNRGLYLKYTVTYIEWETSVIPVEIYIIDVTDTWTKKDGLRARHECLIEYEVDSCHVSTVNDACIHSRSVSVSLPTGGDVIYGVQHQHAGGVGSTLYGEGGRVICSSYPTYGTGDEAGNEAGYIVGMSTCYPTPGSVKISAGETLTLVSNYSSTQRHTGVMGLFYILVSDSSAKRDAHLHSPAQIDDFPNVLLGLVQVDESTVISKFDWAIALFGVGLVLAIIFGLKAKNGSEESYERV